MEYCPKSLYDVVHDVQIPPDVLLRYALDIAQGMHYLHGKKIIHRGSPTKNKKEGEEKQII